jgi:hypothetical protein
MSLSSNVTNLATRVATEAKALRTLINGNLANLDSLTTTDKTNLVAAINEIKSATGTIITHLGDVATLTTVDKTSAVAAINELNALVGGIDLNELIDDTTTTTTNVWSSSKTNTAITAAVAAVVDASPTSLDTLNELAAALGDDANFAATVTNALAAKAADNAVVKLTGNQTIAGTKTFTYSPVVPDASFSIAKVDYLQSALDAKASTSSVGDTTVNYVTTFEAGLV